MIYGNWIVNMKLIMKALILVGTSASGKSTFAKDLCKEYNWIQIERDTYREFLLVTKFNAPKGSEQFKCADNIWKHWKFNSKNEDLINKEVNDEIARAHRNNFNICFSDTNLNVARRDALKLKLEALGYEVEIKVFGLDLSLEELWKRDLWRKNSVGYAIIASQYQKFRKEFPKYTLKDVSSKPECVIFDIDGTLAIMGNRSPYAWGKVGEDEYNELLFISMIAYFESGYKIKVMSGRDSVCRDATRKWIIDGAIKFGANCGFDLDLHMRAEGDMRKDTIIKEELFFKYVDGNYKVKAVYDDRNCIVRLWMDMQFRVYHCGNAWIDF